MKTLFKISRIIVLLTIFAAVAFYAKNQKLKSRSWTKPLQVVIYPINGDNSPIVDEYIKQLDSSTFNGIDQFFQSEAEHYNLSVEQPTQTYLGDIIVNHPPTSP
ncbi:MAG: hypothetical protein GQ532_03160, partial [Methylomarinum sp.]|nr:hypothetical protein [Methylomarinum sp.]